MPDHGMEEAELKAERLMELYKLLDKRSGDLVAITEVLIGLSSDLLQVMIESVPSSKISILYGCFVLVDTVLKPSAYASWSKRQLTIPEFMRSVDWRRIMGALRDQTDHDVCWAIVVSELVRAMRVIHGLETDKKIFYSPQDLIDFASPDKRRRINKYLNHYCYPFPLMHGMKYVLANGIQREEDRPFIGCSPDEPVPYRNPATCAYIKGYEIISSMDQVFEVLKNHPIGANLAIFQPEYTEHQKGIYRGPTKPGSRLISLHAMSLMAVDEENGERFVWARSSEGDCFGHDGCIKVSLDTLVLHLPSDEDEITSPLNKYLFSKPSPLLCNFCYPTLLSRDEEENKRKKTIMEEEQKRKKTSLDEDHTRKKRRSCNDDVVAS